MLLLSLRGAASAQPSSWAPDMGQYELPITATAQAQEYFNEGMRLEFGFNQVMAREFFNKSIHEDAECAMCQWGYAMANGPYLNHPIVMDDKQLHAAYSASQTAVKLLTPNCTQKEKLLITAMAARYPASSSGNQTKTFEDYAAKMEQAQQNYPDDADLAAFAADALMILDCDNSGYNFYGKDGYPEARVSRAEALLKPHTPGGKPQKVLHPYAEHLYIHLTEPSIPGTGTGKGGSSVYNTGRGVASAEALRLSFNATDSQHLQHMPGHTFLRVGRYGDAVRVNEVAHAADMRYLNKGLLPYGPAHNLAFLVYAASMDGQTQVADKYGQILRAYYASAPDRGDGPGPELGWNIPMTAAVRFGWWDRVLAVQASQPRAWPYSRLLFHYARGAAFAATADTRSASAELHSLQQILHNSSGGNLPGMQRKYASVANLTLSAVVLAAAENSSRSSSSSSSGGQRLAYASDLLQDSWAYDEPPEWYFPMRQCLGRLLLRRNMAREADAVYRAELVQYPFNGYSLYGLLQAVEVQVEEQPSGRYNSTDVAALKAQLAESWQRADQEMTSSCRMLDPSAH